MPEMDLNRIICMLGFAMRKGSAVVGTDLVCKAMPSGKIRLVVISGSASDNTVKKLTNKSEFYSIDCVRVELDTEKLGQILGKERPTAAVGVTDEGLATEIKKASQKA